MADLLSSLPGDIPKLLPRASPIVYVGPDRHRRGWIGLIEQVHHDGRARIAWNAGVHGVEKLEHVALDLTDPTGRVHAAWWIMANRRSRTDCAPGSKSATLVEFALRGEDLEPHEIDELARLVLRLAGRSHV